MVPIKALTSQYLLATYLVRNLYKTLHQLTAILWLFATNPVRNLYKSLHQLTAQFFLYWTNTSPLLLTTSILHSYASTHLHTYIYIHRFSSHHKKDHVYIHVYQFGNTSSWPLRYLTKEYFNDTLQSPEQNINIDLQGWPDQKRTYPQSTKTTCYHNAAITKAQNEITESQLRPKIMKHVH